MTDKTKQRMVEMLQVFYLSGEEDASATVDHLLSEINSRMSPHVRLTGEMLVKLAEWSAHREAAAGAAALRMAVQKLDDEAEHVAAFMVESLITPEASSTLSEHDARVRVEALEEAAKAVIPAWGEAAAIRIRPLKTKTEPSNG